MTNFQILNQLCIHGISPTELWCIIIFIYCCCFSVPEFSLTLWDPMDCSMPGLPVLPHLLEFTQTHVHRVSDAVQPPHPLLSPSPPAFSLSQHQGLHIKLSSTGASASASVLPMNIQGWFPLGLTSLISLQSQGLTRVFSGAEQQWRSSAVVVTAAE